MLTLFTIACNFHYMSIHHYIIISSKQHLSWVDVYREEAYKEEEEDVGGIQGRGGGVGVGR